MRKGLHAVDGIVENKVPPLVKVSEDERIVVGNAQDVRTGSPDSDVVRRYERLDAVEHLHLVVGIPVACHSHLSAVEFGAHCQRAFLVEAAEAAEGVCQGVVKLHREGLANAQGFRMATPEQYLS